MRATTEGITLTRAEIAALLEFASTDPERQLSRVRMVTRPDAVKAYASNGIRAVEVSGLCAPGTDDGDWQVERAFLDAVRKVLTAKGEAVLHVTGAGVQEATLRNDEGEPVGTVVWPHNAATTQLPIEAIQTAITIPAGGKSVRCVTVRASQMKALEAVGKGAGREEIDIYAPKTRADPIVFRCESDAGDWIGCIMPARGDEDDDETATAKARAKQARASGELFPADSAAEAVLGFVSALKRQGATVEFRGPTP